MLHRVMPEHLCIAAATGLMAITLAFMGTVPELPLAADGLQALIMVVAARPDAEQRSIRPFLVGPLCAATPHIVQLIIAPEAAPPAWLAALGPATLIAMAALLITRSGAENGRKEMATMIETVPALLWRADGETGGVDYMNRRWGEMGWGLDDLGGDNWTVMMHPDEVERLVRAWQHSVETSTPYEEVMRTMRADGDYRWTVIRAAPDFAPEGHVRKWYGMASDIDDLVRAEERLEAMRNELAHATRVSSLGELTGSIAHEVNQPLGAVVTNAQVALRWLDRDQPDLAEVRDAVADAEAGAKRASAVVNRLRALFRKADPQFVPLDIHEVITDSVALVTPLAKRSGVSIVTDFAEGPMQVRGDAIQLQQVFINLVVNGIEAVHAARGTGQVKIRTNPGPNERVQVAVEDTGPGLAALDRDRLFDAFHSTKPQGLGMGLAICRTILDSHEGSLEGLDAPGGGALFRVILPGITAEAVTEPGLARPTGSSRNP